jgi:hypothetical protein
MPRLQYYRIYTGISLHIVIRRASFRVGFTLSRIYQISSMFIRNLQSQCVNVRQLVDIVLVREPSDDNCGL